MSIVKNWLLSCSERLFIFKIEPILHDWQSDKSNKNDNKNDKKSIVFAYKSRKFDVFISYKQIIRETPMSLGNY